MKYVTEVAGVDLSEFEVIDAHMHPLRRACLTEVYARQAAAFARQVLPDDSAESVSKSTHAGFVRSVHHAPRKIGYVNYVARTYGVPPTLEGFDSIVSKHIDSDADYTAYTGRIMDRERISWVLLQSAEDEPVAPPALIPKDRYLWTYPIVPMVRPAWAAQRNASTIEDVVAAVDATLETAVNNGCIGFKSTAAYYRPLGLPRVTRAEAERAFAKILASTPSGMAPQSLPIYPDEATNAALRTYEDFLYRHMFIKASRCDRPVIIHSAAALSPHLQIDNNDPRPLYSLFRDADMQRAGARFVILHAGYPLHHVLATFASQFPNVYVDVSFFAKYPAVLHEVYRVFLAIAPSSKIMYGSDTNSIPEELGYCAWNARVVLAKVLADYVPVYGWTPTDVSEMAQDVLSRTARTVFNIPS